MDPARDFISKEPRKFRFGSNKWIASSLTGFIAGFIAASIIWFAGVWYVMQLQKAASLSSETAQQSGMILPIKTK